MAAAIKITMHKHLINFHSLNKDFKTRNHPKTISLEISLETFATDS